MTLSDALPVQKKWVILRHRNDEDEIRSLSTSSCLKAIQPRIWEVSLVDSVLFILDSNGTGYNSCPLSLFNTCPLFLAVISPTRRVWPQNKSYLRLTRILSNSFFDKYTLCNTMFRLAALLALTATTTSAFAPVQTASSSTTELSALNRRDALGLAFGAVVGAASLAPEAAQAASNPALETFKGTKGTKVCIVTVIL